MSVESARFGLPFIVPGQAQKEMFHNEAIALIDAALHPAVEGAPTNVPPADPATGQCWLIGSNPIGVWVGHGGELAAWTSGGWRFVASSIGMCAWDKAAGVHRRWTGVRWSGGEIAASGLTVAGMQVVGARQPAITTPASGSVIDQEARATIAALIVALRTHGLTE